MKEQEQPDRNESAKAGWFTSTHWSIVAAAADASSLESSQALEKLCCAYWYPLYAYVRRRGYDVEEAQDLTQEFFARILAGNFFGAADRTRGRFRSFLLSSLEHFLVKEWRYQTRQKRGGGRVLLPLEGGAGEDLYQHEPADPTTPERIFQRRWALALLEQTLARLRDECVTQNKGALFEHLQGSITGDRDSVPYAELGRRLEMSEGAVKVALHRLRQRYGALLREEIAQTVTRPEEVDEELRLLFQALN